MMPSEVASVVGDMAFDHLNIIRLGRDDLQVCQYRASPALWSPPRGCGQRTDTEPPEWRGEPLVLQMVRHQQQT